VTSHIHSTPSTPREEDQGRRDPLDSPALYKGVLWRRVAAYVIDMLLIALFAVVAWLVFVVLIAISFGTLGPLLIPAVPLIPSLYAALTIGAGRMSATPGMWLFRLRVVDWTGRSAGYAQGFLMAVFFYVTTAVTGGLILLVALFTGRKRTVHDMLAGIVVIRRGVR
jgi:uncharacterized RDD family membrane protein YckC